MRHARVRRRDAEHHAADHGLARTGFADQSERPARLHRAADAAQDRARRPSADRDGRDPGCRAARSSRASPDRGASRKPSPSALRPSTATMMQPIGSAISHQAWFTYSRPSWMMPPQVGMPDETDRPTNERIASTTMAMPISSVNSVTATARHWAGSRWPAIAPRRSPMVTAGGHVVLAFLHQHLGAHHAAEARPVDDDDGDDHGVQPGPEYRGEHDAQQHRRKTHPDLDQPRDRRVDPAAEVSGDQAQHRAESAGERSRRRRRR